MIILRINNTIRDLVDLQSFSGSKYRKFLSILTQTLIFLSMLWSALWLLLVFIRNVNVNIQLALSTMSPCVTYFVLTFIHGHILINRSYLNALFEDMQAIINDSKYEFFCVELTDH